MLNTFIIWLYKGDLFSKHSGSNPHQILKGKRTLRNSESNWLTFMNTETEKDGHRSDTPAFSDLIQHNGAFGIKLSIVRFPVSIVLFLILETLFLQWPWIPFIFGCFQVFRAENPQAKMTRRTWERTWLLWLLHLRHFIRSQEFSKGGNKKRNVLTGKLLFKPAF